MTRRRRRRRTRRTRRSDMTALTMGSLMRHKPVADKSHRIGNEVLLIRRKAVVRISATGYGHETFLTTLA